jgi:uridylate kinase
MRTIIKISGEYFKGNNDLSDFVSKVNKKVQLIIMCGGGNIIRGRDAKDGKIYADRMGMLSTAINAISLKSQINNTEIFSTIENDIMSKYNINAIEQRISQGIIPILAGGLGCGYISTDTALVVRGLELRCDCIIKVTRLGQVYDKNPDDYPDAIPLDKMSYDAAISSGMFDRSSICIAQENNIPFIVVSFENLLGYLNGEEVRSTRVC